jgi:uncharacterized membrane protein YeaQ/YmgE (transglycosylase-associated protein family)
MQANAPAVTAITRSRARRRAGAFAIAYRRAALIRSFCGEGDLIMLHLIWYIIVGLIAGFVAKSVLHLNMTLFWMILVGLVGSILGGFIVHLFDRPKPESNYHPSGIIVSILFALLLLWVLSKVPIFSAP